MTMAKWPDKLKASQMKGLGLSEHFITIQGEGVHAGVPAFFIRTQFCPVGCKWCDTKYTWEDSGGVERDVDHLVSEIEKYPNIPLVVITGGEPLYWVGQVSELVLKVLRLDNKMIDIETSCACPPLPIMCGSSRLTYVCSPKLSHSEALIDTWENVSKFLEKNSVLKIVVEKPEDLEELKQKLSKLKVPKDKIYLMPQGLTEKQIQENSKWLWNACVENGYRFSSRLHVSVFGPKRGI